MADLTEHIETSAQQPRRASNDMGSAEQHSLKDVTEADRYLKAATASSRKMGGLKLVRLVKPGAVADW